MINEKEILELRKKGIGYKKIARTLGLSFRKVSDILIKNGMYSHVTMPTDDVVSKIIKMYTVDHIGSKKIAKETGITPSRIISILKVKKVDITPSAYHVGYNSKINHNYFNVIDSERKAYWLGFLYADGYNNEKFYQIEMTLKREDRYILEELKKDLETVYKIFDKDVSLNGKIFHENRLTVYSKQISEDLREKGCFQNKCLHLTFPNENILPKELQKHFMRGYFDGDGCISGNKFMLNGTKRFLDKYVEILRENTDISPAYYWNMDGKAYRWNHASYRDLKKIYNFLYDGATICLTRKEKRFLTIK